jgi:hypothetical protein
MRHILAAVLAAAVLMPAVVSSAQEEEEGEVQTRFYDFNDMLIDGEFMRPEGMFTQARDSARFERLLELRREFMDEIEESAKEEALE